MADKRNPGALAGATGAGKPSHARAAGTGTVSHDAPRSNALAQRIARLRARFGLTTAQAALVAALAWGAGNG
ncbi:MAG: hypothetical protein JJU19_06490 [Pararhodobacter sp.]|nr:hypothetical protein [Pararhodobacter sp.]